MDLKTRSIGNSIVVGAIASLGSWIFLTFFYGDSGAYSTAALVTAAGWWLIVAAAVYIGAGRGLAILWSLLLVFSAVQIWNAYPIDAFISTDEHPFLVRGLGMTNGFWGWTAIALPLFLATWLRVFLETRPLTPKLAFFAGAWLLLLILARPMARVAWDVSPPRYPPTAVAAFGLLVLAPAQLALSIYLTRELWRRDA
jgi:hypothetical protein